MGSRVGESEHLLQGRRPESFERGAGSVEDGLFLDRLATVGRDPEHDLFDIEDRHVMAVPTRQRSHLADVVEAVGAAHPRADDSHRVTQPGVCLKPGTDPAGAGDTSRCPQAIRSRSRTGTRAAGVVSAVNHPGLPTT